MGDRHLISHEDRDTLQAAASTQYRDNSVLVTMKVLEAAGLLTLKLPDHIGADTDDRALHEG